MKITADGMAAGKILYPGNLSQKILAIAAGEAHTLALTGDGCVFSWGRGSFGRLGTGMESDELLPVRVEFNLKQKDKVLAENEEIRSCKFVGIAAGAYHSLALEDDGSVWSWGYNIYGQLGVTAENSPSPHFIRQFLELGSPSTSKQESKSDKNKPLKVCAVKAGGMMSLAIDSQGSLWMWGSCPPLTKTEDGTFSLVDSSIPRPIWDFHGHTVVKVACGNEHVVALVTAAETFTEVGDLLCYTWGNNNHGQLGLGDREVRFHPDIVDAFNLESSWLAYEIACGAHHTAVLTRKKDTSASEMREYVCWTFGLGDNGQLGNGTTNSSSSPKPIDELPRDALLVSVDCGLFHTAVVSEAGDVWAWGMEKGLGLCPDARYTGTDSGDALSPLRISCDELQGPKFADPVQVACGAAHTILVAHDGYKIWAWGRGWSGVLGRGNTVDSIIPCIAMWPPLDRIFVEEKGTESTRVDVDTKDKNESEKVMEMEKKLSLAMEEMQLLQSKLALMERYASILHGSVFGQPFEETDLPSSLRNWGIFNLQKEWENMIELADSAKLNHMAALYKHMLEGVKEKLMKKRIDEIVKETVRSLSMGNKVPTENGSSSH